MSVSKKATTELHSKRLHDEANNEIPRERYKENKLLMN